MKGRTVSWFGLVVLLAVPVHASDSQALAASGTVQAPSVPALTPPVLSPSAAQVVKLSSAGFSDEVILAYVKNGRLPFNLSTNEILRLKEAGVSSPVIVAMLTHDSLLRNQNPPAPYTNSQPAQLVVPYLVAPADQTPPPAPEEVIPVAPGPDYYWVPGYWGWNGGWIWSGGSWCLRGGYGCGGHYGWGWYGHRGWGDYHGGGGYHGSWGGYHGGVGGRGGHGRGGQGGGRHGGGHGGGHGR